jgi:hypothetical protein
MKLVIVAGLAMASLVSPPCMASGLVLTVVQDPSSTIPLNDLNAGQSVMFDVNLSGLDVAGGQTIGTLGGTVVFSANLLGTPTVLASGPIVPDPTGFLSSISGGVADSTYSIVFSNSGSAITANGTFFTFDVTVQPKVAGSGVFSLNPSQGGFLDAFDANGNPLAIEAGTDLPFTVLGAAVPEPSTLLMMGIGLITILGLRRRLRRRTIATPLA